MIVEKLDWVRHAGLQIFSLDIQPDGSRFTTAGGDHKVRIWSMTASQTLDKGVSQPRLLATLRDHFGSVNCVRWAKGGHLLASGSDDQLVLVHKRCPGSGTTEFGSGEAADVENWKNILTLRGHSADVVDLAWSPDDSTIASCSLDNTVRIWSSVNGNLLSVLHGHQSLVKGVAWDPVGSFIASQSDDRTVIIWHTGKWNIVHKADGPWDKTVGSTFFRRLAWSPCGHFITTTHGFQEPSHTAPVLERGDWCTSFDFVGHNAPVVAVRYNHSMFRRSPGAETKNAFQENVNGSQDPLIADSSPYNVIAMGSQDCNITVWTTASPRPVFVGKHFFSQSVVDLSWSTDGYTLLCCSLDGTVAKFSFEPKELGLKVSDEEMEDFKKTRYGDFQVRRLALVESAAQLALEAAAAKQVANSISVPEVQRVAEKSLEVLPQNSTIDRQTRISQQTEYRGADGRRRIIPKPLEQDFKENESPDGTKVTINESFLGLGSSKHVVTCIARQEVGGRVGVEYDNQVKQSNSAPVHDNSALPTVVRIPNNAFTEDPADASKLANGDLGVKFVVQPPTLQGGILAFQVLPQSKDASLVLEARPGGLPQKGESPEGAKLGDTSMETDIVCTQGGKVLWWDRLKRRATMLAGNAYFWVVACEDKSVQVYSVAGRRALPPIILNSPAAFMDCKGWKLLLLTCCGTLHVWDLQSGKSILQESVSAVLSCYPDPPPGGGAVKIVSARITDMGAPLVVLQNRQVFLFHMELRCWLRLADYFPSVMLHKSNSILTSLVLENDSRSRRAGSPDPGAIPLDFSRASFGHDVGLYTRPQLEIQMAAALSLQSAEEYRRCLLAYARCLAREADKARLRELCEELLGPRQVLEMSISLPQLWNPLVLGMKKRDLLKQDVLPAMASNRAIQRLLAEFVDLLYEIESRNQQGVTKTQEGVQ